MSPVQSPGPWRSLSSSLMATRSRRVLLCAALALATGCSTRKLAYNLGERLLARMIDNAAGLRPEQERLVRHELRELFHWHRRSELPLYADHVEELRRRVADGLGREDLRWTRSTVERLWGRTAERLAPSAAALLAGLTADQIDRLERDSERRSRKRYAPYDLPGPRYAERRTEELERSLGRWVGPLVPAQRALLLAYFVRSQPDAQRWRDGTLRRERELFARLRQRPDLATLRQELLGRMVREEALLSAEERQALDRLQAQSDELALALFREATPAQRQRLDDELRQLRDDLRELAQER